MPIFLISYSTKPYEANLNDAVISEIQKYGVNCQFLDDTQWYVFDAQNNCSEIRNSIISAFEFAKIFEGNSKTKLKLSVNQVARLKLHNFNDVRDWLKELKNARKI